tara:strand:+ start:13319 stop:13567 length:249 start_codon:yes stop_codon:yes gene_type:complete
MTHNIQNPTSSYRRKRDRLSRLQNIITAFMIGFVIVRAFLFDMSLAELFLIMDLYLVLTIYIYVLITHNFNDKKEDEIVAVW